MNLTHPHLKKILDSLADRFPVLARSVQAAQKPAIRLIDKDIQLYKKLRGQAKRFPLVAKLVLFAARPLIFITWLGILLVISLYYDGVPGTFTVSSLTIVNTGMVMISALATSWLTRIVKHTIKRARPYLAMAKLPPMFTQGRLDSFPSEHSAVAFAIGTMAVLLHFELGVFALLSAFVVALGRVMAGVHYPFDVIAGGLLGAAIASSIAAVVRFFPITF